MCVASAFDFDRMEKPLCKIAEQGNLLPGENSATPLSEFCFPHALNSESNRLVSEMS